MKELEGSGERCGKGDGKGDGNERGGDGKDWKNR